MWLIALAFLKRIPLTGYLLVILLSGGVWEYHHRFEQGVESQKALDAKEVQRAIAQADKAISDAQSSIPVPAGAVAADNSQPAVRPACSVPNHDDRDCGKGRRVPRLR
jgi:hypothetical protein